MAVDLACTPMIVSESFVKSQKARDVEFTTSDGMCHCVYAIVCVVLMKWNSESFDKIMGMP